MSDQFGAAPMGFLRDNKRISLILMCMLCGCTGKPGPDEARQRQLANPKARNIPLATYAEQNYPPEDQNLFADMDQKFVPDAQTKSEGETAVQNENGSVQPIPDLHRQEIIGRNAWMIWTGGNEAFWDWLSRNGYGTVDLLKVVDDRNRGTNWKNGGLITEPGMRPPTPEETKAAYGIRFPRPIKADYSYRYSYAGYDQLYKNNDLYYRMMAPYGGESGSDGSGYRTYNMPEYEMPTTNEFGETEGPYRDMRPPNPYIYGFSSGIVGLRLFPNPEFKASQSFDADRYYNEKSYASNPETIRPFRVGMACAFCHVGMHPLKPPNDQKGFEHPMWENLSSTIGAQHLRVRFGFGGELPRNDYFYHVLDSQMPGTIDTSLIASDGINNANAMNAIFGLGWRVERAKFNPPEQLSKDSESFPGLREDKPGSYLKAQLQQAGLETSSGKIGQPGGFEGNPRFVPRVLVDGSDSVGSWIALARVYLNIGMYHQRWIQVHNTVLGFRPQTPFKLKDCEENSVYWHATKIRVDPMTSFFLKSTDPMKLKHAPEGVAKGWGHEMPEEKYHREKLGFDDEFTGDTLESEFEAGRRVFAKGCIACHSSVQPGNRDELEQLIVNDSLPANRSSLDLTIDDLYELTRGSGHLPELYEIWAQEAVEQPKFWEHNFLSTDRRIPVTITRTNAGRASATNAKAGHIWEDFASWTYKDLPAVGDVPYFDPFSRSTKRFAPQSGGPGYYRVPTLISAWATAPFLHNNSLGKFTNDPSVDGRLASYHDGMDKLLNSTKRKFLGHDRGYAEGMDVSSEITQRENGLVWRTNEDTFLTISGPSIPGLVSGMTGLSYGFSKRVLPWSLPVLFLILGLIFSFGHRIVDGVAWIKTRLPFQEGIRPLKVILGLVALILSVLLIGVAVWIRVYLRVIEASSNWGLPYLQIQSYIPAIFILAVGTLILLVYLNERTWGRFFIRLAGLACFLCGLVTVVLTGPILAGMGGDVRIGPFPKGMPVNLITNIDSQADISDLRAAALATANYLRDANRKGGHTNALKKFEDDVAPLLQRVSKCPDIVLDHGHDYEFIQNLTDDEKFQLTELVKTF